MWIVSVTLNEFLFCEVKEGVGRVERYAFSQWEDFWKKRKIEEPVKISLSAPFVFTYCRRYSLSRELLLKVLDYELEKIVLDQQDVVHVEVVGISARESLLIATELCVEGKELLSLLEGDVFVTSRPLALYSALINEAETFPSIAFEECNGLVTFCAVDSRRWPVVLFDAVVGKVESAVNLFKEDLRSFFPSDMALTMYISKETPSVEAFLKSCRDFVSVESLKEFDLKGDIDLERDRGIILGLMEM